MQKRLMFVAFLLLAICNRIVAEDQISIDNFSLNSGDTKEVSVVLTNEDPYVGFQFDLYLPDGISVESFSANSSRFPEGTTPQMSQQSDGSYRFIAAALERNPIVGNEGAILTLTVKAADSIAAKDYTGYLRNIKISKTDGTGVTKDEQTFNITVKGAEAYAVLSEDNTVLTFYYDMKKEERNGMSVGPFNGYSERGWNFVQDAITTVVFDASFKNYQPTSTAHWLSDMNNLTAIEGIANLKTDSVTDMTAMFGSCIGLTSLDLKGFKTQNVSSMEAMFYGCSGLKSLDLSGFNTSNVTDMGRMFYDCSGLTSLDISHLNTANVTNMADMFYGCSGLTSLDVSNFNTANVTNMEEMFSICSSLTSLDVSNFKTENVTNMYKMFEMCSNLISLDVSGFNTENVTDMGSLFYGCSGLKNLDLSSFKTQNVTNMSQMFTYCKSLTSLDLSNFNTKNVTSMYGMFGACTSLTSLNVSSFNTSSVTDMYTMFSNCPGLTTLDVSGFNTQNVTRMSSMFGTCRGLTSLDLSSFNTSSVTDMSSMFNYCTKLTTIYTGEGWSTEAVTDGGGMFSGCTSLVGGMGTTYDASHTDATYAHIDGGPDNPGYFTRSGDAPYVAPELYAVLEENASANSMVDAAPNRAATAKTYTMKFYYDGKKTERNGMSVETYREATAREWNSMAESITNVVFDLTVVNDTAITSTGYWFSGFTQLTSIEGLNYLNTSHVADTWAMFEKCSSLKEVNLSNFDTRNVKTMGLMFYGCENLLNLDVSSFNTANVTHTNSMFANCLGLTSLDLSGFNTRKVENMIEMFLNCTHLTTIYAGSDWSTESSAGGGKMFGSCYSLVGGMGTTYDEKHIDATYAHIDGGPDNPGYLTDIADLGKEKEAYAALSSDGSVVTFYYDRKKEDRGGVDINTRFLNTHETTDVSPYGSATTAVFNATFADYKPTSTAYWFSKCSSLKTIRGIENLNTVDVTDMSSMFYSCDSLTSIDVSGFNTENVTNMNSMFGLCYSLARLDVSNFKTENVTNMSAMFSNCHELTSLDLSNFKTDNVTDMSHMFSGSWNLTSVNLSGFNTKNVTDMSFMFYGCFDLQSLDISHFNTANVTNMRTMFYGCGFSSLDLSGFNTAKVTEMSAMFSSCRSLKTIFAGEGWSTAKVEEGIDMFMECTSLVGGKGTAYDSLHIDYTYAHIDGGPDNPGYFTRSGDDPYTAPEPYVVLEENTNANGMVDAAPNRAATAKTYTVTFYYDNKKSARGGIDINNKYIPEGESSPYGTAVTAVFDASFADYRPTSTAYWFAYCSSLTSIVGIENLKTSEVTDMSGMFWACWSLTSLDLSSFDTQNVTNMSYMFEVCNGLTSLNLSSFNTQNVTNMGGMFDSCSGLTSLDLSNFNTENVADMHAMFISCDGLTDLNLSSFNTQNVTAMSQMFDYCKKLKTIYVGEGWSTAKVENGETMFEGCTNLVGGKGTAYDANHVDYTYAHIDGGPDNPGYLTDINSGVAIYVQASEAPYLYAFDANDNALNGDFPGNQMTETETVNGQTFWKTRIYSSDPFNINILDAEWYRTREIYVISDRYFVYEGTSKYTDVTSRYAKAPEIQISSLALPGSHNGWDRTQLFTETEPGRNYSMEVDLTDVTTEDGLFQFKLLANACAWLGITSLTLDAPSYVHSMGNPELIASDRNIVLDMNSAPTRKFLFEATWNGGTQMEEGWTLRISEIAVPHYTFDSSKGVMTISGGTTVAEALEAAGGSSAASALTSIIWQNTTPLTNDDLKGLDNPNMLIYVADASLAPANRDNVIIGNDSTGYMAMNIVLADAADGNGDFYCPIAFTADMISYTHEYRQQTEVGVARGWETIAMPFTVQTITHEKNGVISPFGNDASTKHFWLRQLTQQGLAQARQIEANTPYLISMPNSDAYPVEFNQAGRVTFSSQKTVVPVTQLNGMEAPTATGGMVMIQPNFKGQSAMEMIYALNVGMQRGDHPEGSIFEANYRSVRPFEAFTIHHGDGPAPQFISIVDINNGGTTGIEDVRSLMSDGRGEGAWYDLNGRRLQQKPTRKGVYILNGSKVVIK